MQEDNLLPIITKQCLLSDKEQNNVLVIFVGVHLSHKILLIKTPDYETHMEKQLGKNDQDLQKMIQKIENKFMVVLVSTPTIQN